MVRTIPYALAGVRVLAEAQSCDAAKDHLRPRQNRHCLANDAMARADNLSNLAVDALLPMKLEIHPDEDLRGQEQLKDVCELSVDVVGDELAALVRVAEEEAKDGEDSANGLGRDMPSVFGHLEEVSLLSCFDLWSPTPRTMPIGNMTP